MLNVKSGALSLELQVYLDENRLVDEFSTDGVMTELTTQDASYCFPNFGRRNALK